MGSVIKTNKSVRNRTVGTLNEIRKLNFYSIMKNGCIEAFIRV